MSSYGGGHAAGTGRRGASEFPAGWTRDEITERIVDVARHPDEPPRLLANGLWHTVGVRDGVRIVVLLEAQGAVRAAFPVDGDGVVHNPDRAADPERPTPADLTDGRVGYAATELLARLAGRLGDDDRELFEQMYRAGEWDELGDALAAQLRDAELAGGERELLADLTG